MPAQRVRFFWRNALSTPYPEILSLLSSSALLVFSQAELDGGFVVLPASEMKPNAYDLLMQRWDGNLPVDVERLARSHGIAVRPRFGMPHGESGCIVRSVDDKYSIEYDATQARVRQRFTVAHELGHFALGHLQPGQREFRDKPDHFTSTVNLPKERAANVFAAMVLMPEGVLKGIIANNGVTSLTALANIFDVSREAMTYRLREVGVTLEKA